MIDAGFKGANALKERANCNSGVGFTMFLEIFFLKVLGPGSWVRDGQIATDGANLDDSGDGDRGSVRNNGIGGGELLRESERDWQERERGEKRR